jgi:hypothetical protein
VGISIRVKRKAYNVTLSDESKEKEETPAQDQKFLAFPKTCYANIYLNK